MGQQKNWTSEEKIYLEENYGKICIPTIAENLNRSVNGVLMMRQKLGLGAFLAGGDYITFNQLLISIGYGGGYSYKTTSWAKARNFPIKYKKVGACRFKVVYLSDFWNWAEKNQTFLDFSNFEENAIGAEPTWVKEKRKNDFERLRKYNFSPWTTQEDEKLRYYLKSYKYGYSELSKILRRTEGAIQRRITDLNIKERPIKADTTIKWTDEEFQILGDIINQGYTYEHISETISKSSKAIRGVVYRYYLTENLCKVRKMLNGGAFGENRPTYTLKHLKIMTVDDRHRAKELLSEMLLTLLKHRNSISHSEYWQKDMCMQWDDIKGCTACESDCDKCTSFIRIQPQYCRLCCRTIIDRKPQELCDKCKDMRKKNAQRKYAKINKNI